MAGGGARTGTTCRSCGADQGADADACLACGAVSLRLCACGATCSFRDVACAKCGAKLRAREAETPRGRLTRAKKWGVVVVASAAIAVAALVVARRPIPLEKLREDGMRDFASARYAEALPKLAEVARRDGRDAVARALEAVCYAKLGHEPGTYVPFARDAVAVDPHCVPARLLLARAAVARGDLDEALDHAMMAAADGKDDDVEPLVLAAEIEMRRVEPDLVRATNCVERAKRAGGSSPELRVLEAEIALRAYGGLAAPDVALPVATAAALRDAETACAQIDPEGSSRRAALTLARIQLALGKAADAEATADAALQRAAPEDDAELDAALRFVRGAALVADGARDRGLTEFAALLADRPDAGPASAVAAFLGNRGDGATAASLIADAAAVRDPSGGLHAVLAGLLAARVRSEADAEKRKALIDAAAQAISVARKARPNDAGYATVEGDVAAAAGEWERARAAYIEAERAAPALLAPKLRRALLTISAPADGDARRDAILRAIAEAETTRAARPADPALLATLGKLSLAVDRVDAARDAFEEATRAAPVDAEAWAGLAEAWRRTTGESAGAERLRCLARARDLAPRDVALARAEAKARLDVGDAAGAVAVCGAALRTSADDPELLELRASANGSLDRWEDAVLDLRRLVELGRVDAATMARLTEAELRAGHPERASQIVENAKNAASGDVSRAVRLAAALSEKDPRTAVSRLAESGADLLTARAQLGLGDADAAIATLRRVLAATADRASGDAQSASLLLVLALLDAPKPTPERIAEARAAVDGIPTPSSPGLRELARGRLSLAEQRVDEALVDLRAAVERTPDDPLAQAFFGEALFRKGDVASSLAAFRRAVVLPGAPASLRRALAARLIAASVAAKDPDSAESLAREALQMDAGSGAAADRLAQLLYDKGELRGAFETAERALRAQGIAEADARRLRYRAAIARYGAGDSDGAARLLDGLPEADRSSAFAATLRALVDLARRRYDDAEKTLVPLVEAAPDDDFAFVALMALRIARGDDDAVARAMDRRRAARPADAGLPFIVVRLLLAHRRNEAALREAEACLAARPADAAAAAFVAESLRRLGRSEDAVRRCGLFADRASGAARPAALLLFGRTLAGAGDGGKPLAIARSIESDVDVPPAARREARVLEAESLLVSGRISDAAAVAREIAQDWPATGTKSADDRPFEARVRFVLGAAVGSSRVDLQACKLEYSIVSPK